MLVYRLDSPRRYILVIALVVTSLNLLVERSMQLECYVCQNQEDSKSKCAETVKTCDLSQEVCLSEVRWGSIPHWSLTTKKQYYISKRCATKTECQDAEADKHHRCERIGYNDWNCTSCCSGDKCNYFVTLGAHSLNPSTTFLLSGFALAFILMYRNM